MDLNLRYLRACVSNMHSASCFRDHVHMPASLELSGASPAQKMHLYPHVQQSASSVDLCPTERFDPSLTCQQKEIGRAQSLTFMVLIIKGGMFLL